MKRIDIHIVVICILLAPLSILLARKTHSECLYLIIVLIPQGMLLTRFNDERRTGTGKGALDYLILNELLLLIGLIGTMVGGWAPTCVPSGNVNWGSYHTGPLPKSQFGPIPCVAELLG
jgi:hypothetical protein